MTHPPDGLPCSCVVGEYCGPDKCECAAFGDESYGSDVPSSIDVVSCLKCGLSDRMFLYMAIQSRLSSTESRELILDAMYSMAMIVQEDEFIDQDDGLTHVEDLIAATVETIILDEVEFQYQRLSPGGEVGTCEVSS